MQLGLFTSGYQYQKLEDAFIDAKNLGYDYLELWGGYPHAYPYDLDEIKCQEILALSKHYNLPILVYTPEHNAYPYNYLIGDSKQVANCLAYFKKAIDVAKNLGCTYILFSMPRAGKQPYVTAYKKLKNFISEISAYAREKKVTIILETLSIYEANYFTSIKELKQIIDEIANPYLCGMCDVVASYSQKETLEDYFTNLKAKMKHIHLIDYDGFSDTHLIPGVGTLPLKEMLTYLKNIKYQGTCTVELVNHYQDNNYGAFKLALENIRRLNA